LRRGVRLAGSLDTGRTDAREAEHARRREESA
jgi:hypothetical protein